MVASLFADRIVRLPCVSRRNQAGDKARDWHKRHAEAPNTGRLRYRQRLMEQEDRTRLETGLTVSRRSDAGHAVGDWLR